jgi:pyoverdine/dityrosine biosynthesis protein Dit1
MFDLEHRGVGSSKDKPQRRGKLSRIATNTAERSNASENLLIVTSLFPLASFLAIGRHSLDGLKFSKPKTLLAILQQALAITTRSQWATLNNLALQRSRAF